MHVEIAFGKKLMWAGSLMNVLFQSKNLYLMCTPLVKN